MTIILTWPVWITYRLLHGVVNVEKHMTEISVLAWSMEMEGHFLVQVP